MAGRDACLGREHEQAGVDSVLGDAALELGEHAHHLEQRLAAGRRGVHALLMEVQVDLEGMQLGQERDQVLQRPAKSGNFTLVGSVANHRPDCIINVPRAFDLALLEPCAGGSRAAADPLRTGVEP